MRERQVFEMLPSAGGALAKVASGCPSAGGQRTNELWHRALSQSSARAPESGMAHRRPQRLKGLQRLLPRSLVGGFTFISHRRPNPSVKRTVNGAARSAAFGAAVPPLSAAYLQR
jgi:hypothetical protein